MLRYLPRHWLRLLFQSRGSFAQGVPLRVAAFAAIAAAITALDRYGVRVHLPAGVHESGAAVIALILAFRVNTGYNRFWEARALWGQTVNTCRNLSRLVRAYAEVDEAAATRYATQIVAFAHAMRRHLRGETDAPEIARLLDDESFAALAAAPHRPVHAAAELSRRLADMVRARALRRKYGVEAELLVAALVNTLGGCERIRKTPTPLGLVLLMERFIAIYLATLPFMLLERVELLTPLVTALLAYPILMIDALGAELDDPFGHAANSLPLSRICATIEHDLLGVATPAELLFGREKAGVDD